MGGPRFGPRFGPQLSSLPLLIVLCWATRGCRANADAKRLYHDLINGYSSLIRPVGNNSDRLTVKMGLRLSQLIDVVSEPPIDRCRGLPARGRSWRRTRRRRLSRSRLWGRPWGNLRKLQMGGDGVDEQTAKMAIQLSVTVRLADVLSVTGLRVLEPIET